MKKVYVIYAVEKYSPKPKKHEGVIDNLCIGFTSMEEAEKFCSKNTTDRVVYFWQECTQAKIKKFPKK